MNIPRIRSFWAVSFGHMTNDIFMSMGPVLLAFLSAHVLPISNTQIGAAVSAQQLVGAISQPIFGWLADRGGHRWQKWLGAGGVLWVVAFLMVSLALAMTGKFWLMIVPYALAALGSGAFHPVGTMLAAESDRERAASNLSYFFLLGQFGLALGPALAGFLLDFANPAGSLSVTVTPIFVLALAALPLTGFMTVSMTGVQAKRRAVSSSDANSPVRQSINMPVKPLVILAAMVTLRSLAQPGTVAFIPRLFQQKGWDPTEYGLITSSFWFASGIMGVLFGQLADRYQRRYVIAISLLLSVPSLFFLPVADSRPLAFALAIAAGGLTGGSHSVIVALAQSLLPSSKGFASGLTLGFLFGTGAIGSFLIGGVADHIGINGAFQLVAGGTVLAGLLAALLPAGTARSASATESLIGDTQLSEAK
jgi:FSR family fosmidomycin resistance protein-like MFS transporter